ncbi:MAG: hypothetical protein K0T99_02865 [Alphaproteobacteria bacterium]|nr:hypothetical protein [Alphaproteobacteria bacterium]
MIVAQLHIAGDSIGIQTPDARKYYATLASSAWTALVMLTSFVFVTPSFFAIALTTLAIGAGATEIDAFPQDNSAPLDTDPLQHDSMAGNITEPNVYE